MFRFAIFSIPILFIQIALSQDKGLQIAKFHDSINYGWGSYTYTSKMTLVDSKKRIRERTLSGKNLELSDTESKSAIVFDSPADVKGLSLLSHTFERKKEDELRIFLPAIKRTKRISSSNRTGSFAGSQFSYEDLLPRTINRYNYEFIKDVELNGFTCNVVRLIPKDADLKTNYKYLEIYYNSEKSMRYEKIIYFDHNGEKFKTLDYIDYNKKQNKFWFPNKLHMINHKNGKETIMIFNDYDFNANLKELDLSLF